MATMTLLGTSFQQLHITNIQLSKQKWKMHFDLRWRHTFHCSRNVNVTFNQWFTAHKRSVNDPIISWFDLLPWSAHLWIGFAWEPHTFAPTCIIVWELHCHSLEVPWGVVAISRLMSTSFDEFHFVQNTLWNRRIPDRVTGPFVRTQSSWKSRNVTCFDRIHS